MTNFKKIPVLALLPLSMFAQPQSDQKSLPFCSLEEKVAEGSRINVRVSGVYSSGLEMGVLEDAACPDRSMWVELALSSDRNKKKLKNLLEGPGKAYVLFEGDLYGPPVPDPKLGEAIRSAYHPGWGHLGAFKTKLVVHIIREVSAVPVPKS